MVSRDTLMYAYPDDCSPAEKATYSWIFAAHQALIDGKFQISFGRPYTMGIIRALDTKLTGGNNPDRGTPTEVLKFYFRITDQTILTMPTRGALLEELLQSIALPDSKLCFGVDYSTMKDLKLVLSHIYVSFSCSKYNWSLTTLVVMAPSFQYGTFTWADNSWTLKLAGTVLTLKSWDALAVACGHFNLEPQFIIYVRKSSRSQGRAGLSDNAQLILNQLLQSTSDLQDAQIHRAGTYGPRQDIYEPPLLTGSLSASQAVNSFPSQANSSWSSQEVHSRDDTELISEGRGPTEPSPVSKQPDDSDDEMRTISIGPNYLNEEFKGQHR